LSKQNKKKIQLPEKAQFLFEPIKYKGLKGGRGSGKSHSVARALIIKGRKERLRILCTREFQNSISDSVITLLEDVINEYELQSFYTVKNREIVGENGTRFIFEGLHRNVQKIKSMEGLDICWCEEAHNMAQKSFDTVIPTLRNDNAEIWFTWNPEEERAPIETFFDMYPNDSHLETMNYYDNPFFPQTLMKEVKALKEYDYEKYLHIYEGHYLTISDAQVFRGKFSVMPFDTPTDAVFYHGADWGFSQDPTTLVRAFIQEGCLYIDKEVYGIGIEIDDIPARFDEIETARKWTIIADSARPETISYIRRKGFNMRSSRKGAGSIEAGIEMIRSFKKVYIHERCKNTAYEFKAYSYKVDNLTGNILPVILDKDNHIIDALRYAIEDITKGANSMVSYY